MVEVPPPPATASWQTSSASGPDTSDCVQVTRHDEYVWVRDSKNPGGLILGLTCEQWAAFLGGVQREKFSGSGVSV